RHAPRPRVGRGGEALDLPRERRDEVVEERRAILPILRLVPDLAAGLHRAGLIRGEEHALEADAPRRQILRGDPLLDRLVAVDIVDAGVADVARLEAFGLDVAVVDQIAARHAVERAPPSLELAIVGARAGRGDEQEG